jgi:hypothetical protein
MGEHVNGRVVNALGTVLLVALVVLSVVTLPLLIVTRAGQ